MTPDPEPREVRAGGDEDGSEPTDDRSWAARGFHDGSAKPGPICDLCGAAMRESHCKLICDQCGYTRDCSDP